MRYKIFSPSGVLLGNADTAQHAGDIACANLKDNPDWAFTYSVDNRADMVLPFTRYSRSKSGLCGYVGEPFKTLRYCLLGDDDAGFYVETNSGMGWMSIAWFADMASAYRERLRMTSSGRYTPADIRVTRACNR